MLNKEKSEQIEQLQVQYNKFKNILETTKQDLANDDNEFSREVPKSARESADILNYCFKNTSFNQLQTTDDSVYKIICEKLVKIVDDYCSRKGPKQVSF